MSNRDMYHSKGSSRARDYDHDKESRDDSSDEERERRKHKRKKHGKKSRDRSRSREADRRPVKPEEDTVNSGPKSHDGPQNVGELAEDIKVREMSISPQRDEEALVPSPPPPPRISNTPPPPRISKIKIGFNKPQAAPPPAIKMNLGGTKPQSLQKKPSIASVFNTSDDEEPEEMPAEARMKMRNIGRETPTSAGPNSFGKTKQGFCDSKKIFEKNLKEAMESASNQKTAAKFTNTIFKS